MSECGEKKGQYLARKVLGKEKKGSVRRPVPEKTRNNAGPASGKEGKGKEKTARNLSTVKVGRGGGGEEKVSKIAKEGLSSRSRKEGGIKKEFEIAHELGMCEEGGGRTPSRVEEWGTACLVERGKTKGEEGGRGKTIPFQEKKERGKKSSTSI